MSANSLQGAAKAANEAWLDFIEAKYPLEWSGRLSDFANAFNDLMAWLKPGWTLQALDREQGRLEARMTTPSGTIWSGSRPFDGLKDLQEFFELVSTAVSSNSGTILELRAS